jgi:MFS family permease
VAIFFSASFGGMLLSIVLWEQGIWGWSALKSGLAIAPGPIVVPFIAFVVAGRMIARYGPARVIALGAAAFGAGVAWWALAVEVHPNYVSGLLGGMLLTGIGVGLALPTMMSTASSSLPPPLFATGSAVINMIRQTGFALGIAVLVAVLGTRAAHPGGPVLHVFRDGWWVTAGISFAGIVPALALLRRAAPARTTA